MGYGKLKVSHCIPGLLPPKNWSLRLPQPSCAASLVSLRIPRADHAQYLAHWLKLLKSDPRAIFAAAAKVSEAIAYLKRMQRG